MRSRPACSRPGQFSASSGGDFAVSPESPAREAKVEVPDLDEASRRESQAHDRDNQGGHGEEHLAGQSDEFGPEAGQQAVLGGLELGLEAGLDCIKAGLNPGLELVAIVLGGNVARGMVRRVPGVSCLPPAAYFRPQGPRSGRLGPDDLGIDADVDGAAFVGGPPHAHTEGGSRVPGYAAIEDAVGPTEVDHLPLIVSRERHADEGPSARRSGNIDGHAHITALANFRQAVQLGTGIDTDLVIACCGDPPSRSDRDARSRNR